MPKRHFSAYDLTVRNKADGATPFRIWSGRRDSNPRHPPWQGGTLPLSYARIKQTTFRHFKLSNISNITKIVKAICLICLQRLKCL